MRKRDEITKIYDAAEIVKRDGVKDHKEWITKVSKSRHAEGYQDANFTGKVSGDPVHAVVDTGRWISHCPDEACNGAEMVSKGEQIFFCFSCGNYINGGDAYPVEFPNNVEEIEEELMTRPIIAGSGRSALARMVSSRAILPRLNRSWDWGETIEDLKEQKKQAKREFDESIG